MLNKLSTVEVCKDSLNMLVLRYDTRTRKRFIKSDIDDIINLIKNK